ARLRTRIQQAGNDRAPWYRRWLDRNAAPLRPVYRPALAAVLALGLVGALTVTAISTNLIRVFEPRQIVAVSVSPSSSQGLSKLLDYGQIKWLPAPPAP